jgi:hypothetical protein
MTEQRTLSTVAASSALGTVGQGIGTTQDGVAPDSARIRPSAGARAVTLPSPRFRFQFRAPRRCRYEQCYRLFVATARDLVFCSARCGRAARGYDESGKRLARGAA